MLALRCALGLSFAVALGACGGAPLSAPPIPLRVLASPHAPAPVAGQVVRRVASHRESGVVALAAAGDRTVAFVADEDGRAVLTFDVDRGALLASTPVEGAPANVLVLADGRVAVTLRDAGRLIALEVTDVAAPLVQRAAIAVPAEPIAMALTPDDHRLLVTSGWSRRLTLLDAATLTDPIEVALPREPRAVVVDGGKAFVAHAVGAALSVVDLDTRALRAVDLRTDGPGAFWSASTDRGAGQGYAIARGVFAAREGAEPRARIFAPGVSVDPGEGVFTTTVYGTPSGQPVLPSVHVVDARSELRVGRVVHGDEEAARRCNLPRAAALAGASLYVACLGVDAVVELDARAAEPSAVELRRFPVASGPTGLALDAAGLRAVVWSAFARKLTVLDLRDAPRAASRPIAVVDAPAPFVTADAARLARGRALFHATPDPRITGDGRACASCHPDGREDGLVWATPSGPRQTIMLAGRLDHAAPFGWSGARATLAGHVRDTWKRLGGRGVFGPQDKDDLDALAAYVATMKPPPASAPPAGSVASDPAVVARGRAIFEAPAQGCGSCHPGGHTDGLSHDLGGDPLHRVVDTPTLRFVGGTAPYFHDGRFSTLDDLLRGTDGRMGHTAHLDDADLRALVAYLETL